MKFDVVKSPQGADGEETRIWSVDRYVKNPALSPDGSLLAVVMVEADRFPVALQIPLGPSGEPIMGQEREVTLPIEGAVRRVVYSSCGKWLACEASTEGGDRDQIWFVTTDPEDEGAYPVDMESHETIELVSWDDDNVAYNAFHRDGNVSGKLIHPTAKDSRTIDSRIGGALIHSRDEYSLFRVGSRGNRELLVIRPDGSWRPLLPVDNGSTTEQGFVVPGHGEPTFLVRSDHLAEHFRLLKVTHTEHGSSVDVLLESDDAELEEFAVSTDGSTLAVLWNVQGWCDLEIYRLTPDGVQLLCAPAMPSLIATEPSLTADGRFLALGVSGPEFPPSVVLFDVAEQHWVGEDFSPIASPIGEVVSASLIAEQKLADAPCCINNAPRDQRGNDVLSVWGQAQIIPQLLHFEARDGLGLSGWFYHAVGVPDGGVAPTFVYFHGGPEGQSRPDYNNVLRKVVQAGYHVFMPNVRGSSGFGRKFSQADDRYARFAAIDDAEDALNFLIDQGFTREGEAVIAGRSYGGFLVHSSLTRHAGRWKGGIAACGMSDLLTFYRDTDPWIASAAQPKYGDPNLDTHLLREASPLRQLSRVKVPVLFVHGELDSNVPVSEAYQAMGVLAGHGIDVELLLFSNEGHVFEKLTNRYDMARRVLDFCERLFTA